MFKTIIEMTQFGTTVRLNKKSLFINFYTLNQATNKVQLPTAKHKQRPLFEEEYTSKFWFKKKNLFLRIQTFNDVAKRH